ncbi:MAG: tetratricopeptide repeat protein [Phycisphaerales bacterium]|nr:MAG: tetratricopeptide repeat protein [Phycisphaerales bacterium]
MRCLRSRVPAVAAVTCAFALSVLLPWDGGSAGLASAFGQTPPGVQITADELAQRIARAEENLAQGRVAKGQARATYLELARRDFAFVSSTNPADGEAMFGLAEVARELGNMKDAETQYRRYIDMPDGRTDYRAYAGLGQVYLHSKYYRLALPRFKRAVQLNAASATAYDGLAQSFLGLEKTNEAYAAIMRARELDANNEQILNTFVHTCLGTVAEDGRIEKPEWLVEALRACHEGIGILDAKWAKTPEDVELLQRKAEFLDLIITITQNQLRVGAELDAEKIIRLVRTRREKQQVDQMLLDHESLFFLIYALQMLPEDISLHMMAAELQIQLSMIDQARETLDAILKLQPENQQARAMLNELDAQPAAPSGLPAE